MRTKSTAKPVDQYSPTRHRFLAEVASGHYLLVLPYGSRKPFPLYTDAGKAARTPQDAPGRAEVAAWRWADGHSMLRRAGGWDKHQPLWLGENATETLAAWTARHGDPLKIHDTPGE